MVIMLLLAVALSAMAQTPRTIRDGVYTQAESDRGKAVYAAQCANCHGAGLGGGHETPALTGTTFLAKWRNRPADELFRSVRTTMPADKPGSLSRETNADVVAFVLAFNKLPLATTAARSGSTPADAGPEPARVEGQPIERRPTEMANNPVAFPEQTRAPFHATTPYQATTLIDNLPAPWSIAFLPDGKLLITERLPGSLRVVNGKGAISKPVTGVDALASPGAKGIGLLDVVPDPRFATNHRIFFTFFDYIDGTDSNTCVARARFDEDQGALSDVKVIFRALPAMPSKRLGAKTGGRIAIAPDGSLFVSTGDRSDSPPWDVAQKLNNHLGKILHITADGAPAPDNPFLGKAGVLPEIWAYGVRNPEGLAFDPATGRLWENEHGPRGGDELNIIERGRNYGWPVIVHGIDYPGTAIGEGITYKAGMEEPVYYWDPVIAPSGLAFYRGNLFPEWKGSLFVGGLRARMLVRLKIANDKVVAEEPLLTELQARIREVRVGPDGAVYVMTDSGTSSMSPNTPATSKLLKLTPR